MLIRKVDSNQKQIVKQLREMGVSVVVTSMIGHGFGDIVCGFNNKNWIFEIKDEKKSASRKQLTPDEKKFFGSWKGQVNKVESLDEIMEVINL